MRFKKKQKKVSIRQFVMIFERLIREVMMGRAILIHSPTGPDCLLLPIDAKARFAYKNRPTKKEKAKSITKPARRY